VPDLRVLLVNKYWRRLGGVEEYCFLLKDVLEELGHEVIPFAQLEDDTLDVPSKKYFVSEVDPTASGLRDRLHSSRRAVFGDETTRAIRRLLDAERIDVAHVVHSYHQLSPMFMRELGRRRIPTLLSVHDYKLSCPSYRLLNDRTEQICTICLDEPRRRVLAPAQTRCWRGSRAGGLILGAEAAAVMTMKPYNVASRVLVSNELMRRSALSGGIEADRIRIVPNFWPAIDTPPPRSPGGHVLFVGRLVIEKGVDVLIKAAAQSGVPVRIVGTGALEDKLRELAESLSAPVEFVGQAWGDEVEAEMLAASALVVPSIWHEVSPLVIYQAMTLGVPVIGTRVGGIPDLLGEDRGVMVAAGDVDALAAELGRSVGDRSGFEAMGDRAMAYSRDELSRSKFVERISAAYGEAGAPL
jgi:glycosyltransferase involved in cell wall biosynthesis